MLYKQKFDINYSFPILETQDLFSKQNKSLKQVLPKKRKYLICLEKIISEKNPSIEQKIKDFFSYNYKDSNLIEDFYIEKGGEFIKNNLEIVFSFINLMIKHKICRHSYVIIIGGGAFLDAIGFACSIFHRGIKHIRIPTTSLSQCDGGLGVKNAINYKNQKNVLGVFLPPEAIINDFEFLKTLPKRYLISGFSEIVKVALIKSKTVFELIESNIHKVLKSDWKVIRKLINISAIYHSKHIKTSGDPFEKGSSRPLDFGHWAAHYLETLSEYKILHGEAVIMGMSLDIYYSYAINLLEKGKMIRIFQLFKKFGFKLYDSLMEIKEKSGQLKIFNGIELFREHLGGKLTVLVLKDIGKGIDIHNLDKKIFIKAIQFLKNF